MGVERRVDAAEFLIHRGQIAVRLGQCRIDVDGAAKRSFRAVRISLGAQRHAEIKERGGKIRSRREAATVGVDRGGECLPFHQHDAEIVVGVGMRRVQLDGAPERPFRRRHPTGPLLCQPQIVVRLGTRRVGQEGRLVRVDGVFRFAEIQQYVAQIAERVGVMRHQLDRPPVTFGGVLVPLQHTKHGAEIVVGLRKVGP